MAVAFDKFTSSGQLAQNANASFTHTPVGTPRGVIVLAVGGVTTTQVGPTGMTYGGVAMSLQNSNLLASGEGGWVRCFFLGTGIGTGAKTVASSGISGVVGDPWVCYCYTVTATTDTQVVDDDVSITTTTSTNPAFTLSLAGRSCFCCEAGHSGVGAASSVTPPTSWTSRDETDYGAGVIVSYSYDTVASTDVAGGWTQSNDDAVIIGIAISESVAGRTTKNTRAFPLGTEIGMNWQGDV